ncbi:low temperature requirement protein A [Plantactinospora sp. ZYX-F-223]|uniref:low temperature requirement protein A n=1 Tax=Plantactinospora sp. ZYX-F-223 TaxID=3144103 RepID=UPI0031FD51D8
MPKVRKEPQTERRAARIFIWFAVSAVPWLIGAQYGDGMRLALWVLALAIDYGGFRLGYPVPGVGSIPTAQRNITAEHLSERYQQFSFDGRRFKEGGLFRGIRRTQQPAIRCDLVRR